VTPVTIVLFSNYVLCFPSCHEMLICLTFSNGMKQRITIDDMYQDLWFITNYQPLRFSKESVSFDYVSASFSGIAVKHSG